MIRGAGGARLLPPSARSCETTSRRTVEFLEGRRRDVCTARSLEREDSISLRRPWYCRLHPEVGI